MQLLYGLEGEGSGWILIEGDAIWWKPCDSPVGCNSLNWDTLNYLRWFVLQSSLSDRRIARLLTHSLIHRKGRIRKGDVTIPYRFSLLSVGFIKPAYASAVVQPDHYTDLLPYTFAVRFEWTHTVCHFKSNLQSAEVSIGAVGTWRLQNKELTVWKGVEACTDVLREEGTSEGENRLPAHSHDCTRSVTRCRFPSAAGKSSERGVLFFISWWIFQNL